jgi:predicted SnoaL-like aldol condensation-catalyzing enzyme
MSTEENKQLVLRWKEELWNKRNVNIVDDLCAPDYVGHISGTPVPGPVRGREALKHLIAAYFAVFDIQDTREFLIAEGDLVAIHDTYLLTHTGAFQGIPIHIKLRRVAVVADVGARPVESPARTARCWGWSCAYSNDSQNAYTASWHVPPVPGPLRTSRPSGGWPPDAPLERL